MMEGAEQLAAAVAAALSKSKKVLVNFLSACLNCLLCNLENNVFKVIYSFEIRICQIKAFFILIFIENCCFLNTLFCIASASTISKS